ncbi:putative ABC transporter ATP-binding protein YhcG [Kroppenstedtia guangzhouensis]|uniref:ABC transporter ATP-binding protein YhcG n=1 Tax=Kroppenstedtia guangzhouensis TaxID=1274356 RepID=A0ABQ1GTI1_9BACL|nr:ABC transporter ATP-binding protein [Kroppenstedtia guangzhouensis]GGA50076.1 putative ABC transporter ATP-binding protein YhcG [Kroppenstedtia guangzhouensis]
MIRFENVSKRYLTKTALMDVDLELPEGKIIGVIGENGSGKSTMLKLIAGLVRPSKGRVLVDGEPAQRRIARKVAYLSELETYYPIFTVQETVDYCASQFTDFDRERAREMIDFMRLEPTAKVKSLSKGNRGRVKLVVTLSRNAPYILMDEPLSGLDPIVRDSIIKGLISFVDLSKQTVIITTHEVNEVESLLDQVVALRDGEIIKFADVEELRSNERLSLSEWMTRVYAGHACK